MTARRQPSRRSAFRPYLWAITALAAAGGVGLSAAPRPPDAAPDSSGITLERIMAHPDWLGRAPERPYWADDGRSIYYFRSEPATDGFDPRDTELYQADLTGQVLRRVEPEHYPGVDVADGVFDRERRHKAFERAGDIYVKDIQAGTLRQLTRTAAEEREPFFLADGRIGWLREQQVFARDIETGLEEQLFDLRAEEDPLEKRERERAEADYLRQQQDRLFDWIRDEERRGEEAERRDRDRRRLDPSRLDPPSTSERSSRSPRYIPRPTAGARSSPRPRPSRSHRPARRCRSTSPRADGPRRARCAPG